jgi:hypothetical protein
MAVYREGILVAPKPDRHRAVADPMLARIIDRCLNLRADRRPADAGALLALLDARARWRRTRPLLGLAAAATLLLLLLIASAGVVGARVVQRDTEKGVTEELAGSLARTAGYSVPAVERRLRWHVKMIEAAAEKPPPEVTAALDQLGRGPHGPRLDPGAIPAADRETFAAWLGKVHADRKQTGAAPDSVASIGLVLVTDADAPGTNRGFYLARAHPNGDTEHAGRTDQPDIFGRDFSFRDYFHGTGNRTDEEGRPHPVIRETHISDAYRSQGDDRAPDGHRIPRPWKVDVATPLWDKSGTRVVGLLIFGLNLKRDIVSVLEPVDLGARGNDKLGISRAVKVVLVDDRDRWVWHPDCDGALAEDSPAQSVQHDYSQLAAARGLDPVQALPWKRMSEPAADQSFGYIEADEYVDLVEGAEIGAGRNYDPEIACFTRFSPYAQSKYPGAKTRQWVFVAQVDRKTALRPLDDLRAKIVRVGAVVGTVLALIVAGLWVGLVVVLRKQEFAGHG